MSDASAATFRPDVTSFHDTFSVLYRPEVVFELFPTAAMPPARSLNAKARTVCVLALALCAVDRSAWPALYAALALVLSKFFGLVTTPPYVPEKKKPLDSIKPGSDMPYGEQLAGYHFEWVAGDKRESGQGDQSLSQPRDAAGSIELNALNPRAMVRPVMAPPGTDIADAEENANQAQAVRSLASRAGSTAMRDELVRSRGAL